MINMGTQIGTAEQADFEEGTWTFKMPDGFKVRAGEFAIVDKENYDMILGRLRDLATYAKVQGDHGYSQNVLDFISKLNTL